MEAKVPSRRGEQVRLDRHMVREMITSIPADITTRALEQVRKMLGDYEEPALDPAKDEELRDYIARREREIPAVDALNEED